MKWILWLLCLNSAAYQLTTLAASLYHRFRRRPKPTQSPGISVLKPVRGLDLGFYEAIRSHALQDYPAFELLFAVADPEDPALEAIDRLRQEFPHVAIKTIVTQREAANRKVAKLIDLAAAARYPILLVNDADIEVPPNYFRDVAAPLENPRVGIVTCVFRCRAETWPAKFEAIGVMAEFMPSTMLAPFVGIDEFGIGATLCFRGADLLRIGGYEALQDYIADDYQVAKHITRLGLKTYLSEVVVSTGLHADSLAEAWSHQVRWARTIRVSRPDGYIGLPFTFTTFWAAIAAVCGYWLPAAIALGIRLICAAIVGRVILNSPLLLRWLPILPIRDLFGVAVFIAGLTSNKVVWRGRTLVMNREGKVRAVTPKTS